MKTLLPSLILVCSLGLVGCGDSQQTTYAVPQQQSAPAVLNLEDAQATVEVNQGSLTGTGDTLQLTLGGITGLAVTTDQGSQTVSPDQIGAILANEHMQAVLKVQSEPPVVYALSLFHPVYDSETRSLRFSAAPLAALPEWYTLDETVVFGEGPLQFGRASLFLNAAEAGPVLGGPPTPPLLGGAPDFQTDTVFYRYQESSGTDKLATRSVEVKTPLSISAGNTVSGELKFDFPLDFVELSVTPFRNNLGFALTAGGVDIVPPDQITVPYSITLSTNTKPGTYGVPAFAVYGPGAFDVISLKVQVVP